MKQYLSKKVLLHPGKIKFLLYWIMYELVLIPSLIGHLSYVVMCFASFH